MSRPILIPTQRRFVGDDSRFIAGMFSRQTGKTFCGTLKVCFKCIDEEVLGKKTRWIILSRGERQAKEAMKECLEPHLNAFKTAFNAFNSVERINGVRYNTTELELEHGSRVTALPSTPDTARGFAANVLLDEYAFQKHPDEIWQALFPVISNGFRIIVISTPNGKGNKFHQLMTDPALAEIWSRHTMDIHQAVREGLPRDVEMLRKGLGDDLIWRQEFELEFMDDAYAWLGWDLINAAEHKNAGDPARHQGHATYIGNDIGLRKDLWVSWVDEEVDGTLWTREVVALQNKSFEEHDNALDRLVDRYRPIRICMDQSGMGEKPVEDAKRRYGEHRVEGVLFNNTSKHNLAYVIKERFENRQYKIPANHKPIRESLSSIQKMVTATGKPRFDPDESQTSDHGDYFWAAALAAHAAGSGKLPFAYESIGSRMSSGANLFSGPRRIIGNERISHAGFR
uniref:Mu-like prophage FluMu protein gp28 n=1 Tax=Candidatus Kentrum sp. UNK TaxID=2126344 RepID=A0A451AQN1_9GAMM|nr:MAG: Mu-like prophage FluMu protein gp28 [Candidatus Kentron sp. UNK]VFK68319.1 MAG: Mu-like prophage FluMu protein gp28 [Candidatus Kentron sp. UNK]